MISRGSIIWAVVPDPNGKIILDKNGNPKEHPCVVLNTQEYIDSKQPLVCAAISTKFDANRPKHWIWLPGKPGGHIETGLNEPSVVKSDWLVPSVDQNNIRRVSPRPLAVPTVKQILKWLEDNQGFKLVEPNPKPTTSLLPRSRPDATM
ncbi:MAG TPA: type II toxin-antitoxin system PemK/MazF family toxin [Lacipirellulaceae bacterium]|nr:type II toxin-antitoxin system PemK/MazF family toxin [Lacipirellulaceae bacterium]